jgi:hypothetical protein
MVTLICLVLISSVLTIGILGSFLNLYVFSRKTMRKHSTFRLLLYLSLIDILVLSYCSLNAIVKYGFGFEFESLSDWSCRIETFLYSFLRHFSSLTLIIVNVNRALAICEQKLNEFWSTKVKNVVLRVSKSKNKIGIIMLLIVILTTVFNGHYLYFLKLNGKLGDGANPSITNTSTETYHQMRVNKSMESYQYHTNESNETSKESLFCFPLKDSKYHDFLVKWVYLDLFVYSLIPFFFLSACSLIIVVQVRKQNARLIANLAKTSLSSSQRIKQSKNKKNRKMLIMLLSTNTFFLICSLSFCFFNIKNNSQRAKSGSFDYILFSYSNNAFNFIFYGLFAEKYRQVLYNIFARSTPIRDPMNRHKPQRHPNKTGQSTPTHSTFFSNKTKSSFLLPNRDCEPTTSSPARKLTISKVHFHLDIPSSDPVLVINNVGV